MIEGESQIESGREGEREREGERPGIIFVSLRVSLMNPLIIFFVCLGAQRFVIVSVCVTCPERFLLTAVAAAAEPPGRHRHRLHGRRRLPVLLSFFLLACSCRERYCSSFF